MNFVRKGHMIKELERVALTEDFPEHRLKAGDIGTVVHVHGDGEGYMVEFFILDGKTLDVITVSASQIRRIGSKEIANARVVE
jgi:hypothetical protein